MLINRLAIGICASLITASCFAEWLPVKDVSLLVATGSILDFSELSSPPKPIEHRLAVDAEGRLILDDAPHSPRRFLMASLGFSEANGSFPDHATTDVYVRQLRLRGYNMVRLDFIESTLMVGRQADFDFDPQQLDRFYYLLAALKRDGIYYVLNGLSSENAGYGNIQQRWINVRQAKLGVYYDPEIQAHWKRLMERMLSPINPYSGQSILADPALAGVIMVNEGGLPSVTLRGVPDVLKPLFADWLSKKYGTQAALAQAWNGELSPNELLATKTVEFPKPDAWTGHRMADAQAFFVALEQSTADWMGQHLRQLGYKGLLTAYDNWLSPAQHLSRGQFDWVDLHHYFSEPTQFVEPGSVMRQDSMLQGSAKYIAELAAGRHIGKAFSVSEYGQVFWNKYRRETALALPAYASFQAWDIICQHGNAIELSYAETTHRKEAIYPFIVGTDPIARATETLAALLFLRGDVRSSKHRLGVNFDHEFVFANNAFLGNMPGDIARLGLVTGIGLDWLGQKAASGLYDAQISPHSSDVKLVANTVAVEPGIVGKIDILLRKHVGSLGKKLSKAPLLVDERWRDRLQALHKADLLDTSNRTEAAEGLYESDTGQILLDARRKRLSVVTPKTEAVVFDQPERIELGNIAVEQSDGPALVAVSALDGKTLQDSKRMLVILATDARNSGMRFADSAETTLQELGRNPVLMQTVKLKMNLKNNNAANLKVYSSTLRGTRGDSIPVMRGDGVMSFELDTAKLSHGPTTYFEISSLE